MRTLKFRFWLKGKLQGILELEQNNILDMAWEWDKADQFTGLLDKAGKEIYEGDVVKCKDYYGWRNSEVKFALGTFYCMKKHIHGCGRDSGKPLFITPKLTEVIGNIHENPELLTP